MPCMFAVWDSSGAIVGFAFALLSTRRTPQLLFMRDSADSEIRARKQQLK